MSLAQAIRCFGRPLPPSQEGSDAGQVPEEETGTRAGIAAEQVAKEELQTEEEGVDAQEALQDELAWNEEAKEELQPEEEAPKDELAWKEEEVDELYSQSAAAGSWAPASQDLSQQSWQPFSQDSQDPHATEHGMQPMPEDIGGEQVAGTSAPSSWQPISDSEARKHGLEMADAQSLQEPRRGFADLREEEKEKLLTVSESLTKEIGMKAFYTFDARTSREDLKKLVHTFFSRYRQTETEDHYYETERFFQDNQVWFVSTLITPCLYQGSFRGQPRPQRHMAELSACQKFLEDPEARELASKLPPPSRILRREILAKFSKDWKEDMLQRGISPKLVQQEAVQELSHKLRSLGCRLALWDGHA